MTAAKKFLVSTGYLINLSEVTKRTGIGYGRLVYVIRSLQTDFQESENDAIVAMLEEHFDELKKSGQS